RRRTTRTTAAEREQMKRRKAELVRRGVCRQCTAKRGDSPSTSRCRRCYEKARETSRVARGSLAWRPNTQSGGRTPLDVQAQGRKARQAREGMEHSSFDVPIDRG